MCHTVCRSPVDGRVGCSQCWSIMSSGAVNMSTSVCVRTPVLTSPRSGVAGHTVVLCLIFCEIAKLLSEVIVPFHIPPAGRGNILWFSWVYQYFQYVAGMLYQYGKREKSNLMTTKSRVTLSVLLEAF